MQAVDWNSLRPQVAGLPVQAIATLRWYDAGKIGYALRNKIPVTVFGPEPHEFGVSTPPASLVGKDILLVAMPGDISAITMAYAQDFKTLLPGPALSVIDHNKVLLLIPTLIGHDLQHAP